MGNLATSVIHVT